jgi:hypothetical protein
LVVTITLSCFCLSKLACFHKALDQCYTTFQCWWFSMSIFNIFF